MQEFFQDPYHVFEVVSSVVLVLILDRKSVV